LLKKILHSTIAKIIVGVVVIMGGYWLLLHSLSSLFRLVQVTPIITIIRYITIPVIITSFIIALYILIYRYYERRKITELSTHNFGKYLLFGLLLGFLLPSLSIFVAYLRGEYIILSISNLTNIFLRDFTISIFFGILTAVFEEVVFRGVVFRLIEEKLGSYIAMIISCVIFGFLHLQNGSDSFFVGITVSVISVLVTAAYMYTRNLWFPIAIHFAWNFTEGNIFGTPVSGDASFPSIIVSKLEGSQWFTGGAWGIEATVQTVIFSLVAGIILLVLCHKKGEIVQPYWIK